MDYKEFIDLVQKNSHLPDRDDAERITRATLETLGEVLPGAERDDLAAQLPKELKSFLYERDYNLYQLQEFYRRVGARADSGYYDAAERAKAVMQALTEAVTPGQMDEVMAELPDSYKDLLKKEPQGPGFPSGHP